MLIATREAEEAEAVNAEFAPSLVAPYRLQDWAAPGGAKRVELRNGTLGDFFGFGHWCGTSAPCMPDSNKTRGSSCGRRRNAAGSGLITAAACREP
jgi:hypothetical protein